MLGPRASVRGAFGSSLSEIGERDVPTDLGLAENLHVKGFLEDAFGTALAHDRPLLSRTRRTSTTLIADPHARDKTLLDPVFQAVGKLSGMVTGLFAPITDEHPEPAKVSWAEAVQGGPAQGPCSDRQARGRHRVQPDLGSEHRRLQRC